MKDLCAHTRIQGVNVLAHFIPCALHILGLGHHTKSQTLAVGRMSWLGYDKTNATLWFHLSRFILQDSWLD